MVSDASLDELHDFAQGMGIPRRAFQGDHYDIPEEHRPAMVEAGALEVDSRELVRRLPRRWAAAEPGPPAGVRPPRRPWLRTILPTFRARARRGGAGGKLADLPLTRR